MERRRRLNMKGSLVCGGDVSGSVLPSFAMTRARKKTTGSRKTPTLIHIWLSDVDL
jgi:hypothetical protein